MFQSIKHMNRTKHTYPFIEDHNGKTITNKKHIHKIITEHFHHHFHDENQPLTQPFNNLPRPLQIPITTNEVQKATSTMKNQRAPGYDNISAELIKYGGETTHHIIANILNNMYETNKTLPIGRGILAAIQKPGKIKDPVTNLRPIILLPILRKILSKICLSRASKNINLFLPDSQCAYRSNKSTTEIVLAHRLIIAKTLLYNKTIYITGLDLSSAFDTILRHKLLAITSKVFADDEQRMTSTLLSNTTLEVLTTNTTPDPFTTNLGSPQGDSISGPYFTTYLEHALKDVRTMLHNKDDHNYTTISNHPTPADHLPNEFVYADDTDFISESEETGQLLTTHVSNILQSHNLKVNDTKTEHTIIQRGDRNTEIWRNVKKLGSLLGDAEDIQRRKQLATTALYRMKNYWYRRKTRVRLHIRLQIYKTYIKPILTYNSSTWGLTIKDINNLNIFHRKQLRKVIGLKLSYHRRSMSNHQLYTIAKSRPLIIDIITSRWRLLGHILRQPIQAPAQSALSYYCREETNCKRYPGGRRTTIITTINRDIHKTKQRLPNFILTPLTNKEQLAHLRTIANDRILWRDLSKLVIDTAQGDYPPNIIV